MCLRKIGLGGIVGTVGRCIYIHAHASRVKAVELQMMKPPGAEVETSRSDVLHSWAALASTPPNHSDVNSCATQSLVAYQPSRRIKRQRWDHCAQKANGVEGRRTGAAERQISWCSGVFQLPPERAKEGPHH